MNKPVQVLLCDDQQMIRARVREELLKRPEIKLIGEAAGGLEGVEKALSLAPDLVLMDLSMPDLNGVEATQRILAAAPGIRVVGFSAEGRWPAVEAMFLAGARGFLLKSSAPDEWVHAILRVMAGGSFVSAGLGENSPDGPGEPLPPTMGSY